ncbi:hypothetical protein [Ruminococcus bicirculans (ex Wegman et al. 2014)]|uniref:hypothetical protein n=1 Tax=Ruminococcus bicirculans (ex Wegman et al. 2014) TaxID=1160721 RepID=UPI0036728361
MKTKIIIATAAVIIAAVAVTLFISLGTKSDKAVSSEKGQQELSASPTNLLCPEASSTAFANNFVYYKTYDGIAEYDIESDSLAMIKVKLQEYSNLSCYTIYDGVIYAVRSVYNSATQKEDYSIVTVDYNSGEVTEVYSAPKDSILGCMSMDKDGDIYFVEGKYKKSETDENGFSTGYSLYKYALKNSDKSEITKANTYYISDGKLYFTRLCPKTDTVRLFIAPLSDPQNVKDTGIGVGSQISENTPYMYYPADGDVYYSNGKNKLYRYNEDNEKSDTVCTFKDKSFVRYFQYFNNTMIVLVREPNDNGKMYQYVLYYLDNDNKPQKIIDDAKLNEKYFYGYEYIDYMTIFNNCEDYFLLSTYNPDADTAAYLVDKDFKLHKFISNGEWDYDTYAEIQSEM